jgi:hypothetical protein
LTKRWSDREVLVLTMPGGRGGGAITVEGNRWHVTLGGMLGDHPPVDHAGFEAFAATLPVPDIHQLITDAEPLDDPVPHRFTGSRRQRCAPACARDRRSCRAASTPAPRRSSMSPGRCRPTPT